MEHIVAVAEPGPAYALDPALVLKHGQEIGHDLAGMAVVGEPVDHRHSGMFGECSQLGMIVGADHDRVDIARQDARRVRDRLAAPELHRSRVHNDGRAAKLAHGHVEGDARARRIFLEDHRQHVAFERLVDVRLALWPARARQLSTARIVEHRPKRVRPGIREIEKVAYHSSVPKPRIPRSHRACRNTVSEDSSRRNFDFAQSFLRMRGFEIMRLRAACSCARLPRASRRTRRYGFPRC